CATPSPPRAWDCGGWSAAGPRSRSCSSPAPPRRPSARPSTPAVLRSTPTGPRRRDDARDGPHDDDGRGRPMSDARIVDRGYRHYDGPRLGEAAILRSLAVHSLRRVLGLRRPARAKALPVLVIVIAFFPAVIIVGIAAFVGDAFENP